MAEGVAEAIPRAGPSPERLDALFAVLTRKQFKATPRQRASAALIVAQHLAGAGAGGLPGLKHALCPIFAESEAQQDDFYRLFDQWANPGVAPEILGDVLPVVAKAIGNSTESAKKSRQWFVVSVV